jgi:hypothetical protein
VNFSLLSSNPEYGQGMSISRGCTSFGMMNVLKAVLAAWWEYSDLYEQQLGDDLGKRLEGEVFTSDDGWAIPLKYSAP